MYVKKFEKALKKLNKTECVKEVYRQILNAIDSGELDVKEDIFAIKRRFFVQARDQMIHAFSNEWNVSANELHYSSIQYVVGEDPIPNMKGIIQSKDFEAYKEKTSNREAIPIPATNEASMENSVG